MDAWTVRKTSGRLVVDGSLVRPLFRCSRFSTETWFRANPAFTMGANQTTKGNMLTEIMASCHGFGRRLISRLVLSAKFHFELDFLPAFSRTMPPGWAVFTWKHFENMSMSFENNRSRPFFQKGHAKIKPCQEDTTTEHWHDARYSIRPYKGGFGYKYTWMCVLACV